MRRTTWFLGLLVLLLTVSAGVTEEAKTDPALVERARRNHGRLPADRRHTEGQDGQDQGYPGGHAEIIDAQE